MNLINSNGSLNVTFTKTPSIRPEPKNTVPMFEVNPRVDIETVVFTKNLDYISVHHSQFPSTLQARVRKTRLGDFIIRDIFLDVSEIGTAHTIETIGANPLLDDWVVYDYPTGWAAVMDGTTASREFVQHEWGLVQPITNCNGSSISVSIEGVPVLREAKIHMQCTQTGLGFQIFPTLAPYTFAGNLQITGWFLT